MTRTECLLRTTAAGLLILLGACRDNPTSVEPPADMGSAPVFAKSGGLPFSEAMAELGDEIFDDENLSLNRNQSCRSCHDAEWGFVGPDAQTHSVGGVYQGSVAGRFGDRKPPSSAYSTLPPVFTFSRQAGGFFVGGNFFDGRATGWDTGFPAADQAKGPFLNPVEQALRDPACVVYRVAHAHYADLYVELWGDAITTISFPPNIDALCAEEGDRITLSAGDRAKVDQEYNNIAIAIAVYEESHNLFSSKFDAMRRGLYKFTQQEQQGFALFQGKGSCAKCHPSSGQQPAFTDHSYDNLGLPRNPYNAAVLVDPNHQDLGLGAFLRTTTWAAFAAGEEGKMRVPTLRNVDLRPEGAGPFSKVYMHNGVFRTLDQVVHFYNTRSTLRECVGHELADPDRWGTRAANAYGCWPPPEVPQNVNTAELGNLRLSASEEAAIVAFLRTLSDGFLPSPRGRHLRGM